MIVNSEVEADYQESQTLISRASSSVNSIESVARGSVLFSGREQLLL
jgi:hypothetical protein